MYGKSHQYDNYSGVAGSDSYGHQYGGNSGGYDDQYGSQYSNSYNSQYNNSQYGSSSDYGTSSYGHQSRSLNRSPNSPESNLTPSLSPKHPGYGSPVPRRNNSPGVQISVPNLQEPDSGNRINRYRSCSPGRRNAMIDGQEVVNTNVMNNNPYGRNDSRRRMGHYQSGVETPSVVRPSSVKYGNMDTSLNNEILNRGNLSGIRVNVQPPGTPIRRSSLSPSRMRGMQKSPYRTSPGNVDAELIHFFNAVDTDRSGHISWSELQRALLNGDWTEFDERTCRLMITMFDTNWSGNIDINGFSALWNYINEWQAIFDSFDTDNSGTIDCRELHQAFLNFGYNLPSHFSQMIISVYDKTGKGSVRFDSFINACVLLKLVTRRFEERDHNNTKRIQLNMEQFLEIVLDTCLVNT